MNTLQNADTFFYITSIATILVGILVIIILVYVVRIAQIVHGIVKTLRRESEHVAEDIAELRERVREEGMKVSSFWRFATGFILNRFTGSFTSGKGREERDGGAEKRTRSRRPSRKAETEEEQESEE